jgi:stress-induced-phosphoprotein 1
MSDPKIQEAFQVMFSDMGVNMEDIKKKAGSMQQESPNEPPKQENFFEEAPQREQPKKEAPKKEEPKISHRDLGNQAYKKKDFAAAIQHYNEAFESDSTDVLALNNLAAVFIEQGELEKAHEACDRGIKAMDDQGINDYVKRAKVYARKASIYSK